MYPLEDRCDGDSPGQAGFSKGARGPLRTDQIMDSQTLLAQFCSVTVEKQLGLSEHQLLPLLRKRRTLAIWWTN